MAATPAKAAHAAAAGKREGSDSKRAMTLPWWRRCALAAAFLACFAEAAPLPLPANPATACGPAVTTAWSQEYPSCPRAILGNSVIYNSPEIDPDDECCAGTLKYFGSNSSMPSRNCFCVPSVYERFTSGLVDVEVGEYFGVCTLRGYEIPVYEYGTGACSGAPYNTSALFSTVLFEPEHLAPQKTLHQWLKDLKKDGLILTSFIFGLISAIAFGGAIWIFCFNLMKSMTTRQQK